MTMKDFADAAARLFSLSSDLKHIKEDVTCLKSGQKDFTGELRDVNRRIDDVSRALERLAYEIRSVKDNDAHERRILTLESEKTMLTFERRLPLPSSQE